MGVASSYLSQYDIYIYIYVCVYLFIRNCLCSFDLASAHLVDVRQFPGIQMSATASNMDSYRSCLRRSLRIGLVYYAVVAATADVRGWFARIVFFFNSTTSDVVGEGGRVIFQDLGILSMHAATCCSSLKVNTVSNCLNENRRRWFTTICFGA